VLSDPNVRLLFHFGLAARADLEERAFYDKNLHTAAPPTDDDLYDHVRTGAEGDPKSKLNRRRKGDPGVSLEQLMRFFDPSMTKTMDDSTEVSNLIKRAN
jgi:DnaJ family protein A protein 5